MPTLKRACAHLTCTRPAAPGNSYCNLHYRSARAAADAMYRRERPPDDRGRRVWRRHAQWYLAQHPVCEICGVRMATAVHHVVSYREGGLWSGDYKAVCGRCHARLDAPLRRANEGDKG